jgi:hypothetical protein
MLVIPSTKQIASKILDFPDPLSPVIALKDSSNPDCQLIPGTHGRKLTCNGRADWIGLEAYTVSHLFEGLKR